MAKSGVAATFGAVLLLAALSGGCERTEKRDLVPVEGRVVQGGRPLAGVEVLFWRDDENTDRTPPTSGFTDSEGRYELRTHAGERGAVSGRYRVCIVGFSGRDPLLQTLSSAAKQSKLPKELTDRPQASNPVWVPQKYSVFEKTPLRADVKLGGGGSFDFEVAEVDPNRKRARR